MSETREQREPHFEPGQPEDAPENVPPKAWVTLLGFAAFVVLFGTCAGTFMFD